MRRAQHHPERARRGALIGAVRLAVHVLVRAYLAIFHRFRARNARQLGCLRGHLIVSNHASHLDALALLAALPLRQVSRTRVLCARDYFASHPWRRRLAYVLADTIAMDRRRVDARAVAELREEIRRGANVIVFPEGTRSRDGRLGAFRGGVGLLAVRHGLAVLPAAVRGAGACCPKHRRLPRPGAIEVAFGQPVRYGGAGRGKRRWLAVARDLRSRVARLMRQRDPQETHHERTTACRAEDARPHGGQAQRRRPHRRRGRNDVGQDARLRLPQSAVGSVVDR